MDHQRFLSKYQVWRVNADNHFKAGVYQSIIDKIRNKASLDVEREDGISLISPSTGKLYI